MSSFLDSSDADRQALPKPQGDFAPLARTGNMAGPGETNWILNGQLLVGGHPGLVSKTNLIRNLEGILKEDINLFFCLQDELSANGDANPNSASSAGSNLIRKRNAYGLRFMSSCGPYLSDAKLVAGRLRKSPNSINFMHHPVAEANDAVASDTEATATAARVLSAIMAGDRIYLHCSDGNGRAGTVAALVLGIVHGLSSSEAMTMVDMYRTHRHGIQGLSLETHQQKAQVHRLLSNLEWRTTMCSTFPKSAALSNLRQVSVEKVLEEIKGGLMRRGIHAFIKLRRLLERRDYNNTGNVNMYDLTEALRTLGLGIRDGDIVSIVKRYQHDNVEMNGFLNYTTLLSAIRGNISPERLHVVRKAFDKIRLGNQNHLALANNTTSNTSNNNHNQQAMLNRTPDQVTLLQMKKHYCAKNVHDVKNGTISEGEAVSDFLDTFFNAGVTDRQIVTFDDFVEYYTNVSASFDPHQDRGFQLLVWDCWGLSDSDQGRFSKQRGPAGGGTPSYVDRNHSPTRLRAQQQPLPQQQQQQQQQYTSDPATLMDSIRVELLRKKKKGAGSDSLTTGGVNVDGLVSFVTGLREASGREGRLDRTTFHRTLGQSGGNSGALTPSSIDLLFTAFQNKERSSSTAPPSHDPRTISMHAVVDALCGSLSPTRHALVGQAFASLDKQGTGQVHVRDVAKKYIAKKHPEVISGRHSSDAIFFSFFDGFRKLCSSSDGYITLDMFENYYRVVSASFPDDNYFRILMWSVWELAGNSRLTQHAQHRAIVERATAGAGRHKPGPAHRAKSFPVVDRSIHQQKLVDSAAAQHPVNWEGGYTDNNSNSGGGGGGGNRGGGGGSGGGSSHGIGIVPNASPRFGQGQQSWSNAPHMNHNTRSGTADAAQRTYKSSVGQIIGTGNSQSYWKGGGRGNGGSRNQHDEESSPEELAELLKLTVRNGLVTRGVHGFIALLRAFECEDKGDRGGYDGNIPLHLFHQVLRSSGFNINQSQCVALFVTLGLSSGTDEADEIDYGAFIDSLCGEIHQTRLAMIHQAFSKFDANNNGFVPLEHLHSGYNAYKHPDVTSGKRLASQVHREFVENFTVADAHGKVSIEAFELYFKFISTCYTEDSAFQFMMWNVFDLHQVRAGGQVAGVGLSNVHAAGSVTKGNRYDSHGNQGSPGNNNGTANHYGRKNEFTSNQSNTGGNSRNHGSSLHTTILDHSRPMHQLKMNHSNLGQAGKAGTGGGGSSYRTKQQDTNEILRDEYGNVYSGGHVLARLKAAGQMLGPKSWVGLTRAFQQASNDVNSQEGEQEGEGGLTPLEFAAVLEAFSLGVSEKELKLIFESFDQGKVVGFFIYLSLFAHSKSIEILELTHLFLSFV